MTLSNPPFLPEKGKPPLHLREWTEEERLAHMRMIAEQEKLRRLQPTDKEGKK